MSDPIELPAWVHDLIAQAENDAYWRGYEEGQRALWYRINEQQEKVKPYGA
jgi:hypothetical protein